MICLCESFMNSELIFMVEDAPEGGYTARALGHSIFTEADDLDSLREMVLRCVVTLMTTPAIV